MRMPTEESLGRQTISLGILDGKDLDVADFTSPNAAC